jgi:hypothetical protein
MASPAPRRPEAYRLFMKWGRNDVCHCGSGRKYKKCCLEDDKQPPLNAERDVLGNLIGRPFIDTMWNALDQLEDDDEPDFDRNAYEQGLRWCTSFSCVTPEGENGWLADENLLPLSQDELDHARVELRRGSVAFWQVLDALFARAATRAI